MISAIDKKRNFIENLYPKLCEKISNEISNTIDSTHCVIDVQDFHFNYYEIEVWLESYGYEVDYEAEYHNIITINVSWDI